MSVVLSLYPPPSLLIFTIADNAQALAFRAGVHCCFHEALLFKVPASLSTSLTPPESKRQVMPCLLFFVLNSPCRSLPYTFFQVTFAISRVTLAISRVTLAITRVAFCYLFSVSRPFKYPLSKNVCLFLLNRA